jgi:signal transduction histidine kinase/CheY-like chemotaxis protein
MDGHDESSELDQLRSEVESLRHARAEIGTLYELLDRTSRASSLEDVYAPALDAVRSALHIERSSILLFDPDGVMRFKAWQGLSDAYRAAVEGHSPWTRDVKDPVPIAVEDAETDPSMAAYRPVFRAENIRALAFIPLVDHGELLGKFMVYSAEPRAFTVDEMRLASTVAMQVAYAVAKKRSELEVLAARETAETANRMKDEFLAVVSHELRTPLSAIGGWAALLQSESHDPVTVARGLGVIERNVRAQTKIIEDILDVSRIITGKLVIEPRPVALGSVVADALESVRGAVGAKGIKLTYDATDPSVVVGDPDRLRQIVWNLLSNAIKFTPRGGDVRVRLRRDGGSAILEVNDTGAGIDAELLPHVFERFRQADSSTKRRHGGLGLGLAIVRHLVEVHGGSVRVESAGVGAGATFTVTLPAQPGTTECLAVAVHDIETRSEEDIRGVRVLVVDDEEDAREMVREILSHSGAVVETAASVREGLDTLASFRPQVLISDIGMPDEDGYTLIRSIRRLGGAVGDVPAIALTAYARYEDARNMVAAGYERHLPKPTDPKTLVAAVGELAHGAPPASA